VQAALRIILVVALGKGLVETVITNGVLVVVISNAVILVSSFERCLVTSIVGLGPPLIL
jgi:hypothetical protein